VHHLFIVNTNFHHSFICLKKNKKNITETVEVAESKRVERDCQPPWSLLLWCQSVTFRFLRVLLYYCMLPIAGTLSHPHSVSIALASLLTVTTINGNLSVLIWVVPHLYPPPLFSWVKTLSLLLDLLHCRPNPSKPPEWSADSELIAKTKLVLA
jgi:hypothetical protein